MKGKRAFVLVLSLLVIAGFLLSCIGSDGCDVVANPDGPGFLKVTNRLPTGLQWVLSAYAFQSDMRPGECTIFGVGTNTSFDLTLTQCNIGSRGCDSTFGPTKTVRFSVVNGETYTIEVSDGFF